MDRIFQNILKFIIVVFIEVRRRISGERENLACFRGDLYEILCQLFEIERFTMCGEYSRRIFLSMSIEYLSIWSGNDKHKSSMTYFFILVDEKLVGFTEDTCPEEKLQGFHWFKTLIGRTRSLPCPSPCTGRYSH